MALLLSELAPIFLEKEVTSSYFDFFQNFCVSFSIFICNRITYNDFFDFYSDYV
jgi:hypothetical protein